MKHIISFLWIVFYATATVLAQNTEALSKIPFRLEGNHTFITLKIHESETLHFVFDTGAGGTVINSKTAQKLNLLENKETTAEGASGEVKLKIIENVTLNIGDIELKKVDLQSASLTHLEKVFGVNIDGILGYDLLKKYVVKINYDSQQIEIYPTKGFQYKGNGQEVKIDLGSVPTAMTKINIGDRKNIDAEFILDTGAGLAIGFCTPFAKKHQVKKSMSKTYTSQSRGYSSNIAQVDVGRLAQLTIQTFDFTQVPSSIYDTASGVFALEGIAGVIGNQILKRFNITFDYKRKTSYWEPNHIFENTPFIVSCSGLSLSLDDTKTKVIIENIVPKSPSTTSNLQIGDEVLAIDGIPVSDLTLTKLRKLLRQNDKEIEIKCQRGNSVIKTTIHLKPMI